MSEWICCVVKLGKIETLPNSDFLEITTVMNEYPVILKKGQYKEGQLVSFLSYDTVVPDTELFHFLAPRPKFDTDGNIIKPTPPVGSVPEKNRTIKAKKIMGTYSEGLIIDAPVGFQEGQSVIEYYGLKKREYEEELPDKGSNNNESPPKTFKLDKYDLHSLAKYGYAFEDGENVLIFEKIEGENLCMIYAEDKLWVRSRNYWKRNEADSHWWEIANRENVEEKLKKYPNLACYFELYGAIKSFKYDCEIVNNKIQRKARIFDIFDIKQNKFLNWSDVEIIAKDCNFETVPLLYSGPWKSDRTLHDLAEGQSTIGSCVREGWVMRSHNESWHPKLGRKIIKLKGRGYKLFKG